MNQVLALMFLFAAVALFWPSAIGFVIALGFLALVHALVEGLLGITRRMDRYMGAASGEDA